MMGPGFGNAIGEGIVAIIVLAFLLGGGLVAAIIFGVPWLWALLKPWLHTVTG